MIKETYYNYNKFKELTEQDRRLILDMARGYASHFKQIVPLSEFKHWCNHLEKIKSAFNLVEMCEAQNSAQKNFNKSYDDYIEQMETEQNG